MTRFAWPAFILVACLPLIARAEVSPYQVVLTIPYGNQPGQLDTSLIHGDDPGRTLIAAFHRGADGIFWLMPTVGVAGGRKIILGYRGDSLVSTVEFDGIPCDFLIAREGVYSCGASPSGRPGIIALFAFDPLGGDGIAWRAGLPESRALRPPVGGQLQWIANRPYWVTYDCRRAVPVDVGRTEGVLGSETVSGVPTARGVVSQNDGDVTRDGRRILDLYADGSGGMVFVFDNGGFVIRRTGDPSASGWTPVFDIYDADAGKIRRVHTLPRSGPYGVWSYPWLFEENGDVYQLVLSKENARVIRY